MLNVYGLIFVKKQKRLVHLGEAADEKAALKMAAEFIREGYRLGLARNAKAVDEDGNTVFHFGVEEPKALIITAAELDLLEKGHKIV